MCHSDLMKNQRAASVEFAKMAGGGNDFIVIDNRDEGIADGSMLAFTLCTRRLSVGADGLILVENSSRADVRMIYFNADGSRGEFCGNGTRCVARFALLNEMAGPAMTIETDSGVVPAAVGDDGLVTIAVMAPGRVALERPLEVESEGIVRGSSLRVGVPHYVIIEDRDDFWNREIRGLGRAIRQHRELQPEGTNVNFVRVRSRKAIEVRTYERGVEDETLACGSGVVASVSVNALKGLVDSPVTVLTRSGISFTVSFATGSDGLSDMKLAGDARVVYRSRLTEESWGGFDPAWVRNPTSQPAQP